MIDLRVIEDEIESIEQEEDTTYEACERLSQLYIVRDFLAKKKARDEGPTSDFLLACVGVPTQDLMRVLNEHMEAIRIVYPAEYEAVVSKIKALHRD